MFGSTFFLILVVVAFTLFTAAIGYQSFAEWRWQKERKE